MNTQPFARQDENSQVDAFFESLAGRGCGDGGAAALRKAVLSESAALRAAGATPAERRDSETFARLVEQGVFDDAQRTQAVAPKRAPQGNLRERLQRLFTARVFYPALATCATVACLLVIVPGTEPEPADGPDVLRGAPPSVLAVARPEARAQALAGDLRAAGVQVRVVQVNDRTWALGLRLPPGTAADAALAALQRQGLPGLLQLPAEVTVTQK